MKKSFFYLAAGLMAISACTSEKVLDEGVNGNAIGFQNVVGKQTKAEGDKNGQEVTTDNISQFGVFGYYTTQNITDHGILVFNNEQVTKDKETGKWEYANTRYWVPGATYNFYAYCCGGTELNDNYGTFAINVNKTEPRDRALTITDYQCDNVHQHDLLYSYVENFEATDAHMASNVQFKFGHILSKVEAKFTSDLSADYILEINNVKISGIKNQGNYNLHNKWHNLRPEENSTAYVELQGEEAITARNSGTILTVDEDGKVKTETIDNPRIAESHYAFVIPTVAEVDSEEDPIISETTVKLTFNITLCKVTEVEQEGKTEQIKEKILTRLCQAEWQPKWYEGHIYNYNIIITGDALNLKAIVFESDTVDGWEDPEEVNGNDESQDDYKFIIDADNVVDEDNN